MNPTNPTEFSSVFVGKLPRVLGFYMDRSAEPIDRPNSPPIVDYWFCQWIYFLGELKYIHDNKYLRPIFTPKFPAAE